MCFSVQRVRGSIPGLGRLVKITVCCVEPPLGVTLSPAGSLANSCYPATWGQPVWRRQPFATHVGIPPFIDMDSIHRMWDSNLQPVCQRLGFHTHTNLHWLTTLKQLLESVSGVIEAGSSCKSLHTGPILRQQSSSSIPRLNFNPSQWLSG